MEMAWIKEMMIEKVSSEREDVRWKDNKAHKKLLNEILSHLSRLETITKLQAEVEKDRKPSWSGWMLNSTSTYDTSITWTSHQSMTTGIQHISEILA
jgi:hypothetical protein